MYISQCDIGLVPQIEGVRVGLSSRIFDNLFSKNWLQRFDKIEKVTVNIFASLLRRLNFPFFYPSRYDYKLRFKEVTNLGRHFVFAQYSIPVISDLTPSACSFIKQGSNGFLAYGTDSWYSCLYLLKDAKVRRKLGDEFHKNWKENYSHEVLNKAFRKHLVESFKN